MFYRSHRRVLVLMASLALMAACGGSGSSSTMSAPSSPTTSTGSPAPITVITITPSGVSPKNVDVPAGTQITFVNNDTIEHLMFSDPHPEHTDCPDINNVGFLSPGQSRQTGNMNAVRTCGFHDHNLPLNTGLQGTITTH